METPPACSICLEQIRKGGTMKSKKGHTFDCGHTFHNKCVDKLVQHNMIVKCPMCRSLQYIHDNKIDEISYSFHDHYYP
jgi:hypothetical protein